MVLREAVSKLETFVWILNQTRFKVHNLVAIQLKSTKLGQMANLNVIFYETVSIISWINLATRPSRLLNLGIVNTRP